jgi:cell division protein FtsL
MGKHFALTLQLPKYNSEKRTRSGSTVGVGSKYGMAVMIGCCVLTLTYLVQINSFSTKGYEIRSLEKKIDQLKQDQRMLEVETAELQSLQRIQNDPAVLNMVSVSSVNYVQNTSLTQR